METPGFNMGNRGSLTMLARLHGQLVFVRGLKKYTKPQTLLKVFEEYGPVLHVHLPYNAKKKANIGYGYVVYLEPRVGEYVLETVRFLSIDGKKIKLCRFAERNLTEGADRKASALVPRPHSVHQPRNAAASLERLAALRALGDSGSREHSIKPTGKLYFKPLRRTVPDHSFSNVSFKLLSRPR